MEGKSSPHDAHLRVQLTLLPAARIPANRSGPFRTTLRSGTRQFAVEVFPEHAVTPGGLAVHCKVAFATANDALVFFPPGAVFDVWESSRVGYGMVLGVLRSA